MSSFKKVLTDVFDLGAERVLALDDERAAILAAKGGDQEATLSLIYTYARALRAAVGQYRHAGGVWSTGPYREHSNADLRMAAVEGLIEAVHAFDLDGPHTRLAGIIGGYLSDSVSTYLVSPVDITVPPRTLKRFYGILRAADGNPYEAAKIAPEYEMRRETFLAVLSAVRNVSSYDAPEHEDGSGDRRSVEGTPVWDGRQADAEDRILVEAAFRAVDTLEKDVTSMAYGFVDYDPVPDAEIGARLGLSRQKTQRVRSSALGKMRSALGVA